MGEGMKAYRKCMRKPEGKGPLLRLRGRWVDDIKMDLREDEVVWTEFLLLRIRTSRGLL
jgi:hypothetical protein